MISRVDALRGTIYLVSGAWAMFEVWRTAREIGRTGATADRSSSLVIAVCLFFAIGGTVKFGVANTWTLGHITAFRITGLVVMVVGLALRAWAVVTLGRFFTGTVMIQAGHTVVEDGPYRWLRHPSYTAAGLGLMGYALTTASSASLLVMAAGIMIGLGYRIRIEESALLSGLGDAYRNYASHTKRVIPFVF